MKQQIKWITNSGANAIVTISIDKKEKYINDGWGHETIKTAIPALWTINYSAVVQGHGEVNGGNYPVITKGLPEGVAGKLGKLGFNTKIKTQIENAVEKIKKSDEWKNHLESEITCDKRIKDYDDHCQKMARIMGE